MEDDMTGRFLDKASQPPALTEPTPPVADVRVGRAVVTDIGDNKITPAAENIRYTTDEQMVWQERPSPLVLVPKALLYAVIMIAVILGLAILGGVLDGPRRGDALGPSNWAAAFAHTWFWRIDLIVFAVLGIRLAFANLSLAAVKYRATSQRLFVERGIFVSRSIPYEMHTLGDAVVSSNLILKLFRIENLTIVAPTTIELIGLRNADYVRDVLRSGGQLEAQRADKIRWR